MLGKNNRNGKPMNVLRAQQRFGLRKLNIGVASVLLGTTFLFAGGTSALADTTDSQTSADTATTSALSSSSASADSNSVSTTGTNDTSASSTTTSSARSASIVSTSSDTSTSSVDLTVAVSTNSATVDAADDGIIAAETQEVFDNSMSLSKTTTGYDGTASSITVSINLTGSAGDVFTLQIPKNPVYDMPTVGGLTGTVGTTEVTSDDNYYYVKNVLTSSASFQEKVVLTEKNNYYAQAKPMAKIGTTELTMTLSGVNSNGESVGSTSETYTAIIKPGMNPEYHRDSPSTSSVSVVAVNTNYRYLLNINEADGIKDSSSYASSQINSAVNYGTTITIPVSSTFTLDASATATANNFTDQTTITQPGGMGTDIIISVPKGSGKQNYEGANGYYIIGSYQMDAPTTNTTVTASSPITIVQKLNDDGSQTLTATAGTWTETIRGQENTGSKGVLQVSASGSASSNTLLLDENTSNDPTYINEFGFTNDSILNLTDTEITLKIADGLTSTGIVTPANSKTLSGVTSYDYTLTYADGTSSSGTVNAGDTVTATGTSSIRTAVFKPNLVNVGDSTATATYTNAAPRTDEFKVLGKVAATYDNGTTVENGDQLSSSITATSASLAYVKDGETVYPSWGTTNTQTVIGEDSLIAAQNIYRNQSSRTPGTDKAGFIALTNKYDSRENTDTLKEPTYYYVLPAGVTYDSANSFTLYPAEGKPTISTFWVGNQQVIKIDYSGTGYYVDTTKTIDRVYLSNSNTAISGTYNIPVYVTTATNMTNTAVSSIKNFNSQFTEGKTANTYLVGTQTWTITQASALYTTGMAKGNTNDWYVNKGTSDDKGSTTMNYEIAVVNALTTPANNIHVYINVPKTADSTHFKFDLTGPVTTDYTGNYTVLYSTSAFSSSSTTEPSGSTYVTADQVTDWSAIKLIEIQLDSIDGNATAGYFYLNGTDKTIASDVKKSASLAFLVTADGYDKPQIVAAGSSGSPSITISGTSTIKTILEYEDASGATQTIDLNYSKSYTDGTTRVLTSDFPSATNYTSKFDAHDLAIINNLLSQGYAIDSSNFPASTIENGETTWQDGEVNNLAKFGSISAYYFDGDKVVYKLRQITANISSVPTAGTTQLTDLTTGKATTYPANTPVNSPVNDADSYTNYATATRTVNYVFDGNATTKPSVADMTQTINFESYNTYTVNLVTGEVVNTTTSAWMPVSGSTTATNTYIDDSGKITQIGAGNLDNSTSVVPAVSGNFAGWYLDSSTNANSTALTANQNTTGQLVYKHYQGANITYVDADNNDLLLTSDSVTGKQGATINFGYAETLQNYLDQGYVLSSTNYQTTDTYDTDDNSDQSFTVKLVHGMTETTENKTITRTINVTNPDGSVTTTSQPVTVSRTVTTDNVTGDKTYTDWTTGEWADFTTPTISGYTPTISSVDQMKVTNDLSDQTVQISYTPNQQQAQVNLIDQTTGATLSQDALIGKSDQAIDLSTPNSQLTYYLDHGYQLSSNNPNVTDNAVTPTNYDRDDDTTQVLNVYLIHATVDSTASKTVIRTINVHNPDGTVTTTTQLVILTRTVTTDQVTGKETYGEWSTSTWDQYTIPSQTGYTPSRTTVDTTTVDGQTYDQTFDVYYTPNTQTAVVNIIDETTGQTIKTVDLSGRTAESIDLTEANDDLTNYLSSGYQLSTSQASDVTGQSMTSANYDNDDQVTQAFNVYLTHQINHSTDSKEVTRTINLTNPDGTVTTTKQTATITRPVSTDAVTGTVTQGNWATEEWSAYTTPTLDGYTPTLKTIADRTVDGTTTDEIVNIGYVANQQIASVRIFDDTTNSTLNYDNLTGDSASAIDFTQTNQQIQNYLDQGYELATSNPDLTGSTMSPTDFDDDDDQNQDFTVHLVHGRDQATESRTVMRTINVTNPDGSITTEQQTATITRPVTTDRVTGDKTYDQTVNISYRANQQLAAAVIIDDTTGQRLNTYGIFGPSDSQIDFSEADSQLANYLANGYVLSTQKTSSVTDGTFTPGAFDHDDDQLQTFTAYLCHGTSQTTENKTILRTINVTNPDGTVLTTTQPVELTQTVTTDLVTNQQTISDWTNGQWDAYTTPTIKGYTPSQSEVTLATVDGSSQDQIINISYAADPQTAIVKIVDETTGVELGQRELNGTTDGPIDFTSSNNQLAYYLDHGYQLATDNPDVTDNAITPANYNNDADDVQTFTVKLVHAYQTSQESKTVTRTIKVVNPDGTTITTEQPVTLTRTVTTDQVTGDQTFGDWSTGEWDEYTTPAISGYTPSQATVASAAVDGNTVNQTVTITYLPNTQAATIELVDQTNQKTLQTVKLTGKSDTAINFDDPNTLLNEYLKQGYALATDNDDLTDGALTPADYDHDDATDQSFKVYLVHQTADASESKTVTRTIRVHMPGGTTNVVEQPVTLTRTVTTDQVTGNQTFGDWSTAEWPADQIPSINVMVTHQVKL